MRDSKELGKTKTEVSSSSVKVKLQAIMFECDRKTVREQLEALGYTDVPDEVVDEFVLELNLTSVTTPKPSNHNPSPKHKTPSGIPITRDEVHKQLLQMGYDENQITDELINDLVKELNESYVDAVENSFAIPNNNNVHNSKQQKIEKKQQPVTEDRFTFKQEQKENDYGAEEKQNRRMQDSNNDEVAAKLEQEELNNIRRKVQLQQMELQRLNAQLKQSASIDSIPTSARARQQPMMQQQQQQRRKKADPVSRYHQYNSAWKKDSFLQRIEDPVKSKKSEFGPLGYHALMGGQRLDRR